MAKHSDDSGFADGQFSFDIATANAAKGGITEKSKPHYHGHRLRLRQKLLTGGARALADYELLEMVLFSALPRGDTKPLAKEILAKFDNDFNRALTAPAADLVAIDGVGDAVIAALKLVEAAAFRLSKAQIQKRDCLSSWDALVAYCETVMVHNRIEEFRVIFLDRKNFVVADEPQAHGTVDHVPVYPREVVKRALELSASAIILVHNHPSGDPNPSESDWLMTERIIEAARALDITVHDHIIVGAQGVFSFRANSDLFG